jgi:hypothetical protein
MYSNIHIMELKLIIENILNTKCIVGKTKGFNGCLFTITKTVFSYNNTFFQQTDGLAVGSPLSAILSEIFLQYIKCNSAVQIRGQHKLLGYFQYLDRIMIIYNHNFNDINTVVQYFKQVRPQPQFTLELKVIKFFMF